MEKVKVINPDEDSTRFSLLESFLDKIILKPGKPGGKIQTQKF